MPDLPLEKPFSTTRAAPVPAELRLQARQRIAHAVELGNLAWGRNREPMRMPTCSFDLRGQTAGQACRQQLPTGELKALHVRLNAELMATNTREMLEQTIPHEVAHLLARHYFGADISPHGVEWQRVMRSLGVVPERTHKMPATAARVVARPYVYRCSCRTYELTATRHKRTYRCKDCHEVLRFVSGPAESPGTNHLERIPEPRKASIPPRAPAAPAAAVLPPTPKQLDLAMRLALRHRKSVPKDALADRKKLSLWIEAQLK